MIVWALVAASVVFWGLRLVVRAPAAPAHTLPVGDASALRGDLSRLLGATAVAAAPAAPLAPELAARFKLLGIMAPKAPALAGAPGVALIAVDGKPARAFRVGARIDDTLVLQSVSLRSASIGPSQGAAAVQLDLPPPLPAATGTLPPPGSPGMPSPQLSLPQAPPLPASPGPALPGRPAGMMQRPVAPMVPPPPVQEDDGAPTQ